MYPGSAIFYHPNNSGNTRLFGSYFNTSHGTSTGYLSLPQGSSSLYTPYTLATIDSTQTFTNKTLTSPTLTGSVNVSNVNFTGQIVTVDDGLFIKESSSSYGGIIRFWNNDNSKYIHFQPAPGTVHQFWNIWS